MATATAQRLMAEAAQGRRGEQREREKRLEAEQALADLQHVERLKQYLDAHNANPSPDLLAAWEPARDRMRDLVEPHVWGVWLEPVHPHRFRDGVWTLACPTNCRDWIVERFGRLWEFACEARCEFVICDQSIGERASNRKGDT